MGALRVSRTVTADGWLPHSQATITEFSMRSIVANEETAFGSSAPGIMRSTAENIMVIDYGTPESLDILRAHADELAAVLVEPVQSRKPELPAARFLARS